jgi:hypothetical protein
MRELEETKSSEDLARRELSASPKGDTREVMAGIIRNGTRVKLQLAARINRLQGMSLDKPFDGTIPTLIQFKYNLYDEMVQSAKTMMEGPKPGIDYGKIAAHMPEITAMVENIDESIFKMSPMFFMIIVSQKPDSKNHLSHLSISRAQDKELLEELKLGFGSALDEKDQNWTVSSASVLRTYLRDKGYKFSDDPWE